MYTLHFRPHLSSPNLKLVSNTACLVDFYLSSTLVALWSETRGVVQHCFWTKHYLSPLATACDVTRQADCDKKVNQVGMHIEHLLS